MDQGARGVSLGLQYVPGTFARSEELREIALLVRRKGKVLAVHLRAFGSRAPGAPPRGAREPRNLAALREALDLARHRGPAPGLAPALRGHGRLAHLRERPPGHRPGPRRRRGRALRHGPRTNCETSIQLLLPPWFLQKLPGAWDEHEPLRRAGRELHRLERGAGIGPADVHLVHAGDQALSAHEGMSLIDIARLMRMRPAAALVEIARRSAGRARLRVEKCGTQKLIDALARHPACLFAAGSPGGACAGAFPRFLQIARDRHLMPLQEAVRRMSGATAERFGITDRGVLKEKLAADIVVFDWEKVADTTTAEKPGAGPRASSTCSSTAARS